MPPPIQSVATDMAQAYHKAVIEIFPQATVVIDHFHVVKLINDKLTELRRDLCDEARNFKKIDVIKGTHWLLLKNAENLDEDRNQKKELEKALELNKPLSTAYYLKEDLRQFWNQTDMKHAKTFLGQWIAKALASGIRVLKTMANTLIRFRKYLFNYYIYPISTGPL